MPCVLRCAPCGRLLRMREAEHEHRLGRAEPQPHPEQAKRVEGWAGDGQARPCVLRRARSRSFVQDEGGGSMNTASAELNLSLILSKRSASKDGQATGRAVRPSTRSLTLACSG